MRHLALYIGSQLSARSSWLHSGCMRCHTLQLAAQTVQAAAREGGCVEC